MELKHQIALFDQLGGRPAMAEALLIFQRNVFSDPQVSHFFTTTDKRRQYTKLKAFFHMAVGDNVNNLENNIRALYASIVRKGFDVDHFIVVSGHLEQSLVEVKISNELIKEVMAIAASTKDYVLGTSNDTNMKHQNGNGHAEKSIEKNLLSELSLDAHGDVRKLNEELETLRRELHAREQAIDRSLGYIEFKPDGTILTANGIFLEVMGYGLEEIQGRHHRMFCESGYAKSKEYEKFWNDLRLGLVQTNSFLRLTKNGSSRWLKASYIPMMESDGRVSKVIKLANDITQERNERERMNQTLEQAVDSVVTIDENKLIIFYNKSAERMFGYTREEVMGRNIKMIVPMEHRGNHDGYVEANMTTGVNKVVGQGRDLEMSTKDGGRFWGNLSLSRVFVDEKIQYTAFIKDITITKHNELGFQEVINAIAKIAKGDFDFNINIEGLRVDESVKKVTSDVIGLRDDLKNILTEVNDVVKFAGNDGKLDSRLRLKDVQGKWKELVDSINELLQSIAEPVMEFNKIVTEMSNGDLTKRFTMKANGDIRNMADSLNKAIDNLNDLLYNIGKNADIVASSSMNMLQKTEGMKRNTNEVASAISQMAKGAQDQASRTDESSKLVEKVMSSSNEMETKANLINKAAEKGQKSSENGLKIMKTLVNNMTGIKESAGQTSKSIEILTERAEEIGRTLNVITDIASQTNLLALNAAIEAARAGDAGRGFAVVAEEIRKLAEDSRKSAVEIEKIISDVQKDTQRAGKAIDAMQVSVKDGNAATNEAESIFKEIAGSSEETFSFSKGIQDSTSGQKTSIDLVVKNIEQIVVVAEETAAGTQQVASSSQQLNNSMGDITDGSTKLSGVAAELQTGINKFKLRKAS